MTLISAFYDVSAFSKRIYPEFINRSENFHNWG